MRPLYLLLALTIAACGSDKTAEHTSLKAMTTPAVTKAPFGLTKAGEAVEIYTLTNANGMEARVMNYGATLVSLKVPDAKGNFDDVVLGYDSLEPYLREDNPYFGSTVGRYANRIGGARFELDGVEYQLAANNGPNHLHGGLKGFDKVIWGAEILDKVDKADSPSHHPGVGVKFWYRSRDMEEGYPGELLCQVTYILTDSNELVLYYAARTDKPTVVNLTHHSYFNLTGGKRDVLDHRLLINADRYLPVDENLIPTGEMADVTGTPFDFRAAKAIGQDIGAADEQLKRAQGYDHCWVLNRDKEGRSLQLAAEVTEPQSGRKMTVLTSEPGMQFYSGNFLDGAYTGKNGQVYNDRWALCLETQHFPDSPNKPEFPSTVLRPGQTYRTATVYKFGIADIQ